MVELLLQHGADLNIPNNKGKTPLHEAIEENDKFDNYPIVKLLLERGAKPNNKDDNGNIVNLTFRNTLLDEDKQMKMLYL